MRTVKEISDLTGISVRTLHYYDEIGLLKPTEKSDAGYRLYDDKACLLYTSIGTAKFFTLLLLLYHTLVKSQGMKQFMAN